ncbi:amidohydrolase family protein, partial [Candidatus Micrarchaeota archaeon]|nr:amidohydrolase family protein [Candidatus Micrarchaeota archaeon]
SETRKEVFDCLKEKGKRPVDYLNSIGFLSSRVIASHCVWLTKQEVKTLAKNNVKVAHDPVSNMKLASGGITPVKEMLENNVVVSLGTDGASSNNSLNLLETMKVTCLVHKAHRWDATVITAQQALDFATRNGATSLGLNTGSIEVGKTADIVLIDLKAANLNPHHNLVSNLVYSSNPSNVTDVIIDGKLVMEDRKILTIDEEKTIEEAQKISQDLISR